MKAIQGAFGTVLGLIARTAESMRLYTALVPTFLQNLLWLIERTFLKLAESGYGQNAVVYSVLRLLSSSVAEPPMLAYTEDEDGQLTKLPRQHPLNRLLRNPTPGLLTMYEFWELVTVYLGITGRFNGFIERGNNGLPIAIWPLRPDRVGPIYSGMEQPVGARVVKGWSYLIPGTTHYIAIPREDVLTINLPDPAGESGGLVEGLGPLQVLAAEVGADNEATKLVGSLLANYATPGLVIKTKVPITDKETAKRLKRQFQSQFGGSHRGEPAVLDSDADVVPLSFNLSQLEFPSLRNITETRVAAAYGVPALLVGLEAGISRGARATIQEQREFFTETTLSNYWRRYGDAMSEQVAISFGEGTVCRFDTRKVKALQRQAAEEASKVKDAFQLGAATLDQYLDSLGLDPLPGDAGKVLYVPNTVNVTHVSDLATMTDLTVEQARQDARPPQPPAMPPGQTPKQLPPGKSRKTAPLADILRDKDNALEVDWHNCFSDAESSDSGDGIGTPEPRMVARLRSLQKRYGTMVYFSCAGIVDDPDQGKRMLQAATDAGLDPRLVRLMPKVHVAASIDDRNVVYVGDVDDAMDRAEQRIRTALANAA
jgi:HK97 family phage portal protein